MRQSCGGGVSPTVDRGYASILHHPNNHRGQSRSLCGYAGHWRFDFISSERSIAPMGRRLRLADARWSMVASVIFGLRAHRGAASGAEYVVFMESGAAGRADV